MGALMQPQMQPEAQATRPARGRGAAADVDAQGPQRELAEAYAAHEAAGILPARRSYQLKRTLDLALAAPALLLTLPLYPLITMMIRLESPGPGLYRQACVGKDGRPFVAYKFRTMRHASPEQARAAHLEIVAKWMAGTPLEAVAVSPGGRGSPVASVEAGLPCGRAEIGSLPLTSRGTMVATVSRLRRQPKKPSAVDAPFKHASDPRITRVGRILRKLSIDELPQLINVVRGEMSLVGPRPALPYEVERYSEVALARLRVLPGITGQWQVEGRGRVSFDDMVQMDLDYASHSSLRHDLSLILRTVPAVLRCCGAG